jgi:hypothetical protein
MIYTPDDDLTPPYGVPTRQPLNHDGEPRCYFVAGKLDTGDAAWLFIPGCTAGALDGPEHCMCDSLQGQLEDARETITVLRATLARVQDRLDGLTDDHRSMWRAIQHMARVDSAPFRALLSAHRRHRITARLP